jgi:hypothetical protein
MGAKDLKKKVATFIHHAIGTTPLLGFLTDHNNYGHLEDSADEIDMNRFRTKSKAKPKPKPKATAKGTKATKHRVSKPTSIVEQGDDEDEGKGGAGHVGDGGNDHKHRAHLFLWLTPTYID